jgi:hypothetical protein
LPSSSLYGLGSLKLFPLFAAGIVDTGGKFATSINNISKAGGKICRRVVDAGGKNGAGVVDTAAILPPVLLKPVVHLDLQISPRIFKNIQNGFKGIFRGWGETFFFQGIARTQSPTIRNYVFELPIFGVIVGVMKKNQKQKIL